eukprot:scpid65989/ scgid16226/ Mitochondrial GTPase 1; GTP-binding protein 7
MAFRKTFQIAEKTFIQSFPNHMAKGLLVLQHRSPHIDGVFLVHDARIPLSGYSDNVFNCLQGMPLLLILNKADLVPREHLQLAMEVLETRLPDVPVMTSVVSQQHRGGDKYAKDLLPAMLKIIDMEKVRQKRASHDEDFYIRLVVAGIPNCGKSSVINALRRMHAKRGAGTRSGRIPGITRAVMNEIIVNRSPQVMLVDTPGIMDPSIPNSEVGLQLALVGTIASNRVDQRLLCDYLLYRLNKHKCFQYAQFLGMDGPCDDIETVMVAICKRLGHFMPGRRLDYHRAQHWFLDRYRKNMLGRFIYDLEPELVEEYVQKKKLERLEAARLRDHRYMADEEWWKGTGLAAKLDPISQVSYQLDGSVSFGANSASAPAQETNLDAACGSASMAGDQCDELGDKADHDTGNDNQCDDDLPAKGESDVSCGAAAAAAAEGAPFSSTKPSPVETCL